MATLTYNGIVLDTIQTTALNQEAEYDPTHTDYLRTKITIGVKAVINRGNQPANPGETPAQTVARIRSCLMAQNGVLEYRVGADVIVSSPQSGPEDAKHGPFPVRCNILQLTEATFLIEYVVETYIIECCSGSGTPYLSNRWEEAHGIDQDMYTKRTIKGRIIFRADQINSKKFNSGDSADSYRGLIGPPGLPLQPNFRRVSMDFVVQADGLALDYTVVDQEEYTQPPDDCTRFEADHTVTTTKGAVYTDVITVKVWGNALTPKSVLILRAAQIISGRLDMAGNKAIRNGAVKTSINENWVEIRVETFGGARSSTFGGLNIAKQQNTTQLDYLLGDRRSNKQPDPGTRGTANLAMIVFDQYMSLCSNVTGMDAELRTVPFQKSSGEGYDTSLSSGVVSSLPPTQPTLFNPAATAVGVYTEYWIETDYRQSQQTLQMPYMNSALTACAVVPLAGAIQHKVVRYKAERWGLPPAVPAAITSNPNNVFLSGVTTPMNVDLAPDGITPVYSVTGEYVFAVVDWTQEAVLGGLAPYVGTDYTSTQAAIYGNGLTDPSGIAELRGGPFVIP